MHRTRQIWKVLGFIWVLWVVYLSLTPSYPFDSQQFPYKDKMEHLVAYGFLMLWFAQVYLPDRFPRIAVRLIAMGIVLEGIQYLTPYRTFEVGDGVANALGVLLGWFLSNCGMNRLVGLLKTPVIEEGI